MQLPGPGVFGPPRDRTAAIAVLRRAVELGVDHIDTAQYYGPGVANELIRTALRPYPAGLALVSKVGARRDASGGVLRYDRPAELRQGIEDNLRGLAVDHLTVVNLRLMDDAPPGQYFDDQLAAMVAAREDGLIGGIGLSNITPGHLRRALAIADIACVQNLLNLADRRSMPDRARLVLTRRSRHGAWPARDGAGRLPDLGAPYCVADAAPFATLTCAPTPR